MEKREFFTDYLPPVKPLADNPAVALTAVPLDEIVRRSGDPEPYEGKIFSPEASLLAREGRIASGQPGSNGDAVFREGIHPGDGARFLLFPRALPKRVSIRLERHEVRRFFA